MATDDIGWLAAELEVTRNELRRVRNWLDAVTEHSLDPVAMRDRDGKYVFVNAAAAAVAGLAPAAYMGRTDSDLFGPEVGASVRGRDLRIMETGKPELYRYQGDYLNRALDYSVTKWPWRDENGRIVGVVLHSRDVSELTIASREAADLSAGMVRLVESLPDVVLVHRDGMIVYANSAAEKVWPMPSGSLAGASVRQLFSAADIGALLSESAETSPFELLVDVPDGSTRTFVVRTVDAAWTGRPAQAIVARDVTEDRRVQAQLGATDRLAAVGMMASGIVHEVRNPLTFVLARLTALQADPASLQPSDLAQLVDAAQRMSDILADVARFGGTEREDASHTDVEIALDRALNLASGRIRASVRVLRERGGVPAVLGGERRLCQVFLNLLVNGAQAAEAGVNPTLTISTCVEAHEVAVRFRDSGSGVPAALARKVFEPFVTTKREGEGTGLGLWVSQGIVAECGGRIVLENPGQPGASFVVYLQRAAALGRPQADLPQKTQIFAKSPAPVASPESAGSREMPYLLVIDDEPLIGDLLALGLAAEFVVEVVGGVAPALARLRRDPMPDVVLCDLIMPGGGGPSIIRALEAEGRTIPPVVFMSGGAATPDARTFLSSRGIEAIEKPFRIHDVRLRLEQARKSR